MEVLSSRVLVYPADFDRTVRWYDDVLGLARYREFGTGGRITGVVYFLGTGFLEVSSHGGGFGAADGSVRGWPTRTACASASSRCPRTILSGAGPDGAPTGGPPPAPPTAAGWSV